MKYSIGLLCVLFGTLSCSDVSRVSDQTLVVRGKVMTGAKTRTPLSGGYVAIMEPQATGGGHWIGLDFPSSSGVPNKAVTGPDGSYSFTIDITGLPSLPRAYPLFLAASDSAQTFTMLAELPQDTAVTDAELSIDITPTSTVASEMICPGGVYPPPANSWCYSDPNNATADNANMQNVIDSSIATNGFTIGTPPNWGTFSSGFLNDPTTFGQIKNILTGSGVTFGTADKTSIASTISGAPLPIVKAPTVADANTPTDSSGGSCTLNWNCTVDQCTGAYGSKTGSRAEPDKTTCEAVCASSGSCTCSSGCT